ncbi:MAG: YcaQ family DNA glycosylase [Actinobacteria bacterium]|nr:YcaQ family DNA glycosylase [Actinomycetota bacterium]
MTSSPPAVGPARPRRLGAAAARRIALAAQGFADPRPAGRVDARHLRRVMSRLGVLQLDSVNVFCRSHYLPMFSRLGPYPREALDRLTAHTAGPVRRELFEYWAHEASLVPVEVQPLLRWRMARAATEAWGGMVRMAQDRPGLVEEVLDVVARRGPIRSSETGQLRPPRHPGQMWNWHDGKVALEYLFWAGRVTAARRVNFERLYDLPERVLPAEVLTRPTPDESESQRELIRIAARAMGVATEPDLGDYFRLSRGESKLRVAELVKAGELEPITVEGWRAPAYLWPDARQPRRVRARALLSPFDNLIWYRERTQRLFGFRYRIEIYTPAPRRVYGYYVLPFLLGDRLVARVDLKSDRAAGILLVPGAFLEPDVDQREVAVQLAAELRSVAAWLGLSDVRVGERGKLAAPLALALRSGQDG